MNRAIGQASIAATMATLLLACAAGTPPRWQYDREGQGQQYKRYPRNLAVDYMTRFRRVAYIKVTQPLEDYLSDDQRQWISQHGQPDYRRRPFRSREGERVEEWLHLTANKMVQFVKGRVVFDGEVTDVERIMITYGYPRGCLVGQAEPGAEQWAFIYARPFDLEREVFHFANGKLLYRQTQR